MQAPCSTEPTTGKIRKFRVIVTQEVIVTLDAEKFDEAFMQEFRESFFNFDTLEEHAEHIGQLEARGLWSEDFTEGYGPPAEMGITVLEGYIDQEVEAL